MADATLNANNCIEYLFDLFKILHVHELLNEEYLCTKHTLFLCMESGSKQLFEEPL